MNKILAWSIVIATWNTVAGHLCFQEKWKMDIFLQPCYRKFYYKKKITGEGTLKIVIKQTFMWK